MYRYLLTEKRMCTDDNISYTAFGIRVLSTDTPQECEMLNISDISCDASKISRLAELCNELQLDPIHLHDVIDDIL